MRKKILFILLSLLFLFGVAELTYNNQMIGIPCFVISFIGMVVLEQSGIQQTTRENQVNSNAFSETTKITIFKRNQGERGIDHNRYIREEDTNLLQELRNIYEERLNIFYQNNRARTLLENDNIKLKLTTDDNFAAFYCINKKSPKGELERFFFNSKNFHLNYESVLTIWALYDMEFRENTTIQDLINLYTKLMLNGIIYSCRNIRPILHSQYMLYFVMDEKPFLCCNRRITIYSSKAIKKQHKCESVYANNYFIVRSNLSVLYDIYFSLSQIHTKINNYDDILLLLSQRTDCKVEKYIYNKPKEKQKTKTTETEHLIDVNNATSADLAKLPGINIILAKRIIQQRKAINGFKNKNDFYEFCQIKPHFIKQLDNLITIREFDIIDIIFRESELTVDLINNYEDFYICGAKYDDDKGLSLDL